MEKNCLSLQHQLIRIHEHTNYDIWDEIVAEYPLEVYYNGRPVFSLSCSPAHIKELVVGALFHRGYLYAAHTILSFSLSDDGHRAHVVCTEPTPTSEPAPQSVAPQSVAPQSIDPQSVTTLTATTVYDLMEKNLSASDLFQNTGGVHCVSLYLPNVPLISMEDLARHNAVDKVIGHALLHQLPLVASTLIVSGRLSADMLQKAVTAQIPIVLSKSAPTSLAVSLAQQHGITLVGFIRGTRMNLYTNPQRIDYAN